MLLHAARLRPCSGILVITDDADITSENLPVDGPVLLHKPFGLTRFMEQVRIIAKRCTLRSNTRRADAADAC